MPFVQSGDARIHWQAEGEGTPVLLIMGHLYSSRMWYSLVPKLAKRHRVIRFDNRGTGQSDTTTGLTVEQMAADALAVLDAAEEDKAHVYGVSMGGGIAGEFAIAYPGRTLSVTLGCTLLKTEVGKRGNGMGLLYYLPAPVVRWLLHRLGKPENYGSDVPRDAALHDIEVLKGDRFTMKGVREQSRAIDAYVTTGERARAGITMPALVLHGDEDKTVDVKYGRELGEILPHAHVHIFPGAGHNYLIASGGAADLVFMDFIDGVDASGGPRSQTG